MFKDKTIQSDPRKERALIEKVANSVTMSVPPRKDDHYVIEAINANTRAILLLIDTLKK